MHALHKKPVIPRLQSKESAPYPPSEESFNWAVSYADVLMVLLSFFIIFFSLGKDEGKSIIQKILLAEKPETNSQVTKTQAPPKVANGTAEAPKKQITEQNLMIDIQNLGLDARVIKLVTAESVVLMLPKNSFRSGQIELNRSAQAIFLSTLRRLTKYKNEIEITFVGFSDAASFRKKNRVIQSNFDLSALRATHALEKAVQLGFPVSQLKAKGNSHYGRESRTLSIEIHLKEKP